MDGQGKGSKVFDVVAPLAAGVMASYGPNGAAAATAGVRMLDRQQALRRRNALGKDIVRLADTMADQDYGERQKSHDKMAATTQQEAGNKENMLTALGNMPGTDFMPAGMGAAFKAAGQGSVGKRESREKDNAQRMDEFLAQYPEPVRDETLSAIGDMAMNSPEAALAFISDKQKFAQQVRLSEVAYYQDLLKDRVKLAHDDEQRELDRDQQNYRDNQQQDFQTNLTKLVEGFKDTRSDKDNSAAFDRTKYSSDAGVEAAKTRADAYATANLDKVDKEAKVKIEKIQADIAGLFSRNGIYKRADLQYLDGEDLIKFQELSGELARQWGEAGLGDFGSYEYVKGPDGSLHQQEALSNLVGRFGSKEE